MLLGPPSRLTLVALVCKQWRQLSRSTPRLLCNIEAGLATAPALRSFCSWLAQPDLWQHVRCVRLVIGPMLGPVPAFELADAAALLAAACTAACTAGGARELHVYHSFATPLPVSWMGALDSLRALTLSASDRLDVPHFLAALPHLERLWVHSSRLSAAQAAHLPPSLTRLHLGAEGDYSTVPLQVRSSSSVSEWQRHAGGRPTPVANRHTPVRLQLGNLTRLRDLTLCWCAPAYLAGLLPFLNAPHAPLPARPPASTWKVQ